MPSSHSSSDLKSSRSFPAVNESPAPCNNTTFMLSSWSASLSRSASPAYMDAVIAFFFRSEVLQVIPGGERITGAVQQHDIYVVVLVCFVKQIGQSGVHGCRHRILLPI